MFNKISIQEKILALVFAAVSYNAEISAQEQGVHQQSKLYEWPSDPLVKKKLDKWQDQKFGMIIHWGLYAVPGIIESWSICSEDWIERDSTIAYEDYKKWYWGQSKLFNPVRFNPEQWAKAGKDAGMKYLVFTTKHHDGFSMFDTKESDFKISAGPFASNPRADVARHVFNAFRKQDFMIGAYFSKPDWHSEYFWWPKYATADRNANYDIRKYAWRWNKFKQFSYNQISELMHNYGSVDILWLDGGWVRPLSTVNDEVRSWGAKIPEGNQEIDIPRIASMARQAQPGLLVVDRTVHGPYENYQTPEQRIPDHKIDNPWESCMTLGGAWGYVPNDQYKDAATVVRSLIEIVAKGGSLLLGVGPRADGTLPEAVIQRLEDIGKWMKLNGPAIYNTRAVDNYRQGDVWFTRSKDSKTFYALYASADKSLPDNISWNGNKPHAGSKMKLLSTGESLRWTNENGLTKVYLPSSLKEKDPLLSTALAISFDVQK
ncbi:alpha-L-fucosidase [Desertivirga brevis]|uniref:alpha-L-fucosidase n=1 Tax=Desertivirga brevis TaxID=2810310 RepID=UPI001A96E8D2|nr:alpha-L-fucosidase [Pedobacter sp. SYSU D00873]